MYRIGIDVGGTNTDAVIMRNEEIIAFVKSATSANVTDGIVASLEQVMADSAVEKEAVEAVMLGTTHFTNAVLERRDLESVACIRLGLPAASSLPPFSDWPEDLHTKLGGYYWLVHGGHEMDGRPLSELQEDEIREVSAKIKELGLSSIAISSVFSPVNHDMELKAGELVAKYLPQAKITLSHQVGQMGLLERENAAILNASLRMMSETAVEAFNAALSSVGLRCPFYITQNDGTLMDVSVVRNFPVLTFASGPTNSMRGASFLTGHTNAIVLDVGGTTSDIGSLVSGFPKLSTIAVDIGGVRTNFRMPDVYSIALGGGTKIELPPNLSVGPQSVGFRLTEEARVFGGNSLTASDCAIAAGLADFGNVQAVKDIPDEDIDRVLEEIGSMFVNAVERMRVSPDAVPVIAVGGGSILVPDKIGNLPVSKPPHYSVANAIGAAISQISGETEKVYMLDEINREEAIEDATQMAIDKAVEAGAVRSSIEVLDKQDIPLAYLPGNATRIYVKVVGELNINHRREK